MAYLLDTVALVFWWSGSPSLGKGARIVLEDNDSPVHLSPISVWEIANKNRVGKLPEFDGFEARLPAMLRQDGFKLLNLEVAQALRAGYLPGSHRDPFDRLLAGQALVDGMTVLTNDPQIAAFGCTVLW